MKSAPAPIDFQILVQQVQNEIHANHLDPVDALRCVIEQNALSDGEGIRLFSAIMHATRHAGAEVGRAA